MPTMLAVSGLCHLYEPPKPIGSGDRAGCSFRGYHKTKIKNDNKEWEDHFTSIRGTVWGKEAEWLCRDGQKGTLVMWSGRGYVEKWEKDGKSGATLRVECSEAKIAERREDGEGAQPRPAPAAARPASNRPAASADDGQPPF
jgi:single-stranded DNA-binding protein